MSATTDKAAHDKAEHDKAATAKVAWEKAHPLTPEAAAKAAEAKAQADLEAADEKARAEANSAKKVAADWKAQNPDAFVVDNFELPDDTIKPDYSEHPLLALKSDQGVFVPKRPDMTVADLAKKLREDVHMLHTFGAHIEKDVNGDNLLETVIVETKKRAADGSVEMSAGRPVMGSSMLTRPKLIHTNHFSVHPVNKGADLGGHKAPADGVLVVRRA